VPTNFREDYMRVAKNKEELYKLLTAHVYKRSLTVKDLAIYVTDNAKVHANTGTSFHEPSNHVEADTRVALFVQQALIEGHEKILVRTGDSDVIFILIGQCKKLLQICPNLRLFIDMHTTSGKNSSSYLDVVKISRSLGLENCIGFPLFHAYTGCDYTPSFYSIGKAKWFDSFVSRPDIMTMFARITEDPTTVQAEDIIKVTRFTLAVYGVDDPSKGLLEGRFDRLTTKKISSFRSLPPSPGAAIIQFRKSVHIAAYIWGRACDADLNPPDMCSPLQGWQKVNDKVEHMWTVTPEPEDSDSYSRCRKKCGCRRKENICEGKCTCREAGMPCLISCKCRKRCVPPPVT
jgi:hypothetical protein